MSELGHKVDSFTEVCFESSRIGLIIEYYVLILLQNAELCGVCLSLSFSGARLFLTSRGKTKIVLNTILDMSDFLV